MIYYLSRVRFLLEALRSPEPEITYRRAAQTPVGDSTAVAFVDADFGLALFEFTAVCPRQVLCAPALQVNSENGDGYTCIPNLFYFFHTFTQ